MNATRVLEGYAIEELLAMSDERLGLCAKCGATRACCEPDAHHYRCDECGANTVFGIEALVLLCAGAI